MCVLPLSPRWSVWVSQLELGDTDHHRCRQVGEALHGEADGEHGRHPAINDLPIDRQAASVVPERGA